MSNKEDFERRLARLGSAEAEPTATPALAPATPPTRRLAGVGLGLAFGFAGMGAMVYMTLGHAPEGLTKDPKNFLANGIRARMSSEDIKRMEADPRLDLERLRQQGHSNPDLARLLLSN